MGPVQLFELASQQAHWLSARQVAVAENIANANTPGYKAADVPPFRIQSELDQATGVDLVKIKNIGVDHTPFRIEHDRGSPAADSKGFVKLPNVNMIMEMANAEITPAEVTVLSTDGVLLAAGDD